MADCKHVWVGVADGVHCEKCGVHLTHDEYVNGAKAEKPKRKTTKK